MKLTTLADMPLLDFSCTPMSCWSPCVTTTGLGDVAKEYWVGRISIYGVAVAREPT
jgi:hypothetical protein